MTDRFPLVANSSTSQIQEIPHGDTLDLSGNNVKGVGIITATTFSGNLTGNVTGNASGTAGGLSGTPNITVGTVTGTDATFSGNLTVNGTTTTIDTAVTDVDSLAVDGNVTVGGNLGLAGQTSPASNIHIGDISNGYELKVSGNAVQFNRSSNSYIDQLHDTGSILFRMTSSNTEAMRITSSGQFNVGSGSFVVESDGDISTNVRGHGHIELDSTGTFSSPKVKLYSNTGNAEFAGTIEDSIGPLRRLGINAHNAATYTLVAGDAGKLVREATNSANITIPQNVFAAGDMISIFNVSGGDNTITQGTGTTLYNTADGATGNRTLGPKGVCTIVCTSTNEFIISGSQIS